MLVLPFETKKASLRMSTWYIQQESSSGLIHIYKDGQRLVSRSSKQSLADPILKAGTRVKDEISYIVVRTNSEYIHPIQARVTCIRLMINHFSAMNNYCNLVANTVQSDWDKQANCTPCEGF